MRASTVFPELPVYPRLFGIVKAVNCPDNLALRGRQQFHARFEFHSRRVRSRIAPAVRFPPTNCRDEECNFARQTVENVKCRFYFFPFLAAATLFFGAATFLAAFLAAAFLAGTVFTAFFARAPVADL